MPQGQFSSTDVQPSGRYLPSDVGAPPVADNDGFLMKLIHRLVQNNPVTAGQGVIGAGGVTDIEPGEFHWSDVHPSLRNVVKATADELKQLWPDAGTGVGNLITLAQTAKPVAPETIASTANAVRPGLAKAATTTGKLLQNEYVGMAQPRLPHAGQFLERLGKVLQGKPSTINPEEFFPSAKPDALSDAAMQPQPDALSQAAGEPQAPAPQQQPAYPSGIQPRPSDRAEILDDKAVRERAANDMGMQLYRAKREIGEESAPAPKWQQVAQAQADKVRADAEVQAQKILADAEKAATTPAKLTKTTAPKVKAAAASQAPDLNDPDVLMGLLKRSLSDLK